MKCFRKFWLPELAGLALAALTACTCSSAALSSDIVISPLRHVIVIVGENHSFDNLFGAYRPDPRSGQSVTNLLSEGIISSDGMPGPHFGKAQQWQAIVEDKYSIAPSHTAPYARLPQPNTTNAFGQPPGIPDAGVYSGPARTVHSSSASTRPISSDIPATPRIASSRCGSSTTKAATICSSGTR